MTRIAIIGTGNVGSAVGAGAAKAGYDVVFAGQDADKAETVAEDAGGSAATTPREAVAGADIVVLAVPYSAVEDVAREIAPVAAGKIVIDPTNPLKADYSGLATDPGTWAPSTSPPSCRTPRSSRRSTRCSRPTRRTPRHTARSSTACSRPTTKPPRTPSAASAARSASDRSTSVRWPPLASSRRWPGSTSACRC